MKHIDKSVKAVLFDLDDTLVGTREPKWRQHKYVAKTHYNKLLTDEEIAVHWGKPLSQLMCLLYETDDADTALKHVLACHTSFPKELFVGTIPLLQALHASGRKTGIVTATKRVSIEHDIAALKLPVDCIDYIQTEEDTLHHKPDPRVFEPAITWLHGHNIAPHEVIYVADSLNDHKAATGAGFLFLGVHTGMTNSNSFAAQSITSVNSIADIIYAL